MKTRKTRHDYWNYNQEVQEQYLNRRYQFGYLEAGYYLKFTQDMKDFLNIMIQVEISNIALRIIAQSLREAKLI
ncbi:MAG: hypothetical protein PHX47_02620 [Candidatus ainarchaeum sp.]|nr:hypothetical protein [Candidatus ainarchaeum sp.]